MAKQSKRSRKFQASGGVQARLKKGTITKHGKLKKRGKHSVEGTTHNTKAAVDSAPTPRDRSDDIAAPKNLGNLDLDAFFSQAADNLTGELVESEASENEMSDDESEISGQAKKKQKGQSSESSASENSDDESDDDMEAAEARMKKEMERLTEKDPEFHQFLKENEEQLLDFGQDDDEDEPADGANKNDDDDDEEAMEDQDGQQKPATKASDNGTLLTVTVLDKLRRNTFEGHGIKALKKLVTAYKAGCHLADAMGDEKQMYAIESSQIFDSLMVLCLSRCHEAFTYHLLGQEVDADMEADDDKKDDADKTDPDNQAIPPHKLENSDKWDAIKPILQSFLRSTIHLLTESKEPGLLSFVLKSLAKYLPLMAPFPRIAEALLKTCIGLWSAPLDSSENFQVVRLQAFFRIRQLALTQPFPFIETCLKKTYLAYSQRATFGTSSSLATTLPTLTFMGNCLVELYSLDYQSSYQHAFVYIRQLALLLRAAIQKKTPEALAAVYGSWQFMHCLKLWVAVLAQAASKEDEEDPSAKVMMSLVYPLTEIIAGTARTAPSPVRLFPLRLQCIRLLQQLAASAQIYLPTTSLILDCFDWKEWTAKPKKSTKKNTLRGGLPLYMLIKLPKEDPLRTHEQLEAALVQIFILLEREMELYRYTAAFAEFRVRIRQRCRDFLKAVRSSRWKAYAKACMDKSDEWAKFCTTERAKLSLAPKDITSLECLRPSHVPTMRERHEKSQDEEEKPGDGKKAKKSKPQEHKKTKKDKQKKVVVEDNDEVMQQEDEVVEGVDWLEE
eukprot:scaffold4442_cov125-Amphora_coffeaeformis.AAC.1